MKKLAFQIISLAIAAAFSSAACAAMDEADVKSLMKKNNCFKCHAENKAKDGPSYKEIADKQKGKADAEAKIIKHITTTPKVEIKGAKEDHEPLKTKDDAEIKAIAQWILSR